MHFCSWTCWRGVGVGDTAIHVRGLVCGCVNGAGKFTPVAWVTCFETNRVKTHVTQGLKSIALFKWARTIIGIGKVQLDRLVRCTLTVVF
jgi:hypothetical protein